MMWFRHEAIVVLAVGFLLAPSTIVVPTGHSRASHDLKPIAHATCGQTFSPATSRSNSVLSYSPFRSRLKSVLEQTDPRVVEELDLGPVSVPSHVTRLVWSGPVIRVHLDTIPLRC
jgi:hypothetical protein